MLSIWGENSLGILWRTQSIRSPIRNAAWIPELLSRSRPWGERLAVQYISAVDLSWRCMYSLSQICNEFDVAGFEKSLPIEA